MFDTADRPGLCHYQDCSNLALVDGGGLGPCFCCGYQGCALHLGYEHDTCFSILQAPGSNPRAEGLKQHGGVHARGAGHRRGGGGGWTCESCHPGAPPRRPQPPRPPPRTGGPARRRPPGRHLEVREHERALPRRVRGRRGVAGARKDGRLLAQEPAPRRGRARGRDAARLHSVMPGLVPNAWLPPNVSPTHPVFMLVEHVEGITFYKALKTKKWDDPTDVFESVILPDLAAFYIKLTSKPFTEIGCLALAPASTDQVTVGPLQASVNPVFWSAGAMGPFGTNATAWLARIDHVLWLLDQGAIYPPNGDKMHCWGPVASDPVAMYLVHLEARRLVQGCAEMAEAAPTYICHNDDNGDHYLLAEDGRVRGVIDWEMAYTAPLAEVFATNYLWKNGPEGPSRDELRLCDLFVAAGRGDLAAQVKKCRKYHYLRALVGGPHRLVTIDSVWRLRRSFLGDAAGPVPPSLGAWMADRMGELGDDGLLRKIAARVWEGEGGAQAVARQRERYIQQHEAHCQKQKDEAEKAAAKGKEGKQAEDTTSSHDLKGAEESHL